MRSKLDFTLHTRVSIVIIYLYVQNRQALCGTAQGYGASTEYMGIK